MIYSLDDSFVVEMDQKIRYCAKKSVGRIFRGWNFFEKIVTFKNERPGYFLLQSTHQLLAGVRVHEHMLPQ